MGNLHPLRLSRGAADERALGASWRWSGRLLWMALALILWVPGVGAESALVDASPPRLVIEGELMRLTQLPPVLEDSEVQRHLATGLTTTFVFRLTGRAAGGQKLEGAARVEIRYEPWDEVYFLEALGFDGSVTRESLASPKALAGFWHDLRLVILRRAGSIPSLPRWKVALDVIPFSRGEQRDTRRWFSESMGRDGNAEEAARASEERSETLEEVFNLLLATSIQRRAMSSYDWQVQAALGAKR